MWIEGQDEEQNKNQNPNPLSVGTGGGSSQPGGVTGNPSTINPVQSSQPKQEFATVQDYFSANKPQAEQLGQQFTNKLTENAANQKSTISGAATQAIGDITANTVNPDAGIVSKAQLNPTEVANDPNQLQSFLKQWNAAYKGPESFEASNQYENAAKAGNAANQTAEELKTTGGQQQLLQDEFNVYGQGNKGLDQGLLQTSSYFPKVQEQAKEFKNVGDYLSQNAATVNDLASQAKNATEQTKVNARTPFATSLTDFQTDLNNRTTAAQNKAKDVLARYQGDLSSADPAKVSADLKEAGVDDTTAKNIVYYLGALNKDYNINPNVPSSYIGNPNVDITPSTVASKEDYNKAAALNKLTGVDYSGILNPADISKAGTGTLPQQAFKSQDLENYLKQSTEIQDKSILQKAPTLPTNATASKQMVSQYLNAMARQGIQPKNEAELAKLAPNLDKLYKQAQQARLSRNAAGQPNTEAAKAGDEVVTALQAYFEGGNTPALPTNRPVTPSVSKGSSEQIQNQISQLQNEMAAISKTTTNQNDLNRMLEAYNKQIADLQSQLT